MAAGAGQATDLGVEFAPVNSGDLPLTLLKVAGKQVAGFVVVRQA